MEAVRHLAPPPQPRDNDFEVADTLRIERGGGGPGRAAGRVAFIYRNCAPSAAQCRPAQRGIGDGAPSE